MVATAVGEEPDREPPIADLIAAFQRGGDQIMAALAEFGATVAAFAPSHPEGLPEGLDQLPPMRGFMLDAEDGR